MLQVRVRIDADFDDEEALEGSGAMARWLRALPVLLEDLGSLPGTHDRWLTPIYNSSSRGSMPLAPTVPALICPYPQADTNTYA